MGSTAIGIQTSEGVCLAVEKRITSPLMEPNSIEKIVEIDSHIGKWKDKMNVCCWLHTYSISVVAMSLSSSMPCTMFIINLILKALVMFLKVDQFIHFL